MSLGVHTSEPPAALQPFTEWRRLPDPDVFTDDRAERMLKLGFTLRKQLDRLELPWWP